MVIKNVKRFEDLKLIPGKVLLKAVEKTERVLNLIEPGIASSRADDAMQRTVVEYAEVVNANGCKNVSNGDVVIAANYSAADSIALKHLTKEGDTYIIISEHSLIALCTPDNYIYNTVVVDADTGETEKLN